MDMIADMWGDGWMGRLCLLAILAGIAIVLFLVWMLVYWACDSWFRPQQVGAAVITGRNHCEAYTTTHMQQCGKNYIPITTYHPESWSVSLQMADGRADDVYCDEEKYVAATNGKPAAIRYKVGRLSGGIYITEALWNK